MVGTRFPSWPSDTANPPRERWVPKILYEWTFPAGCGYACRIVETAPGIVQMQQRPLDIAAAAWETVPVAMGAANELVHLHQEVLDLREQLERQEEVVTAARATTVDRPGTLAHTSEVENLRHVVERHRAGLRPKPWAELFCCPDCGKGVAADEDGCCANCGADCVIEPSDEALRAESEALGKLP